jgi:hypothetical protein
MQLCAHHQIYLLAMLRIRDELLTMSVKIWKMQSNTQHHMEDRR